MIEEQTSRIGDVRVVQLFRLALRDRRQGPVVFAEVDDPVSKPSVVVIEDRSADCRIGTMCVSLRCLFKPAFPCRTVLLNDGDKFTRRFIEEHCSAREGWLEQATKTHA